MSGPGDIRPRSSG